MAAIANIVAIQESYKSKPWTRQEIARINNLQSDSSSNSTVGYVQKHMNYHFAQSSSQNV